MPPKVSVITSVLAANYSLFLELICETYFTITNVGAGKTPSSAVGDAEPGQILLKRNRSASSGHHVQLVGKQVRRSENCESLDQPAGASGSAGQASAVLSKQTPATSTATIGIDSGSKGKVDQV